MATNRTGNAYVDSLISDRQWEQTSIDYYFDNKYSNWTEAAKNAYRAALDSWASVADLTFRETFSYSKAELVEYYLTDAQMDERHDVEEGKVLFGKHRFPGMLHVWGWYNSEQFGYPIYGGENPTYYPAGLDAANGGFGYRMFLHELGHALGLAHPHDDGHGSTIMPGVSYEFNDYGTHDLNQGVFTIMSYNRGWAIGQNPEHSGVADYGYNSGPGALDIAAIQHIYGANMSTGAGNNTYVITDKMGWKAIWDVGGTDRIIYNGSESVKIDLRAATLDGGEHTGGYLSYVKGSGNYGGYTIAGDITNALANRGGEVGVIIENATGGNGADELIGNSIRNVLIGRGGADKIFGNGGNDLVWGGNGYDKIWGGSGYDKLWGGNGYDRIAGGDGYDKIWGGNGNDRIWGGNGRDQLWGQAGNDRIWGGNHADKIGGGDGNDQLYGGAGDDKIWGGNGHDSIDGGAGNDEIWGINGSNNIHGSFGNDTIIGGFGDDQIWGDPGDDILFGLYGYDDLYGGGGEDVFVFSAGYGGDSVMDFGNGDDWIAFDDALWGGGLSVSQVVDRYANDIGNSVMFDFGGGDYLTVLYVTDLFLLEDSILII